MKGGDMNYEEKEKNYIFLHSIACSSACADDSPDGGRLHGVRFRR